MGLVPEDPPAALADFSRIDLSKLDLEQLEERARQASLMSNQELLERVREAQGRRRETLKRVDEARRALWTTCEESSLILQQDRAPVDAETVLDYAKLIASTSSAPFGYDKDRGTSGQLIQLPYPDEAMMRRGRLAMVDAREAVMAENGHVMPGLEPPEHATAAAAAAAATVVPMSVAPTAQTKAPLLDLDSDDDA